MATPVVAVPVPVLFLLLSCLFWGLSVIDVVTSQEPQVVARHGIVAADHGQCSRIGKNVLRDGGNAVDAAVATAFCLGVVSPASSGIGGGAFMLVRLSNGTTAAFDMRETAPLQASKDMYGGNGTLKARGPLSIAVPGELMGLENAWKKYGRLSWSRLIGPSARLAEDGFQVSPYLDMQLISTKPAIMADEGLRSVYTSNGTLLKLGDICRNRKLGQTLRMISRYGAKAFYNGPIGLNLVNDLKKAGGILTTTDLKSYRFKLREPISVNVMGLEIISMPPPSSGGASMALMLNILAQYKDLSSISDSLLAHREIEALKNVFAVRLNLGDPDFVDIKDVLNDMLSKDFAAELRKNILDNTTFGPNHYGGKWNPLHDHGTTHLSVVDKERNAVSMTTTINAYFGSKILSPSTGIVLNNEMDDFSMPSKASENVLPPAPPNFIYPQKRPLSSVTPTIILKGGQLKAVVGSSGGSMIIGAVAEVIVNHFARGKDPLSSILSPRLYHKFIPNVLQYENWTVPTGEHFEVGKKVRVDLAKKGHVMEALAGGTVCQFIVQELNGPNAGQLIGISDPRKGGYPSGF